MKELDFSLATTAEIIKELAQRAKQKRKKNRVTTEFGKNSTLS